MEPDLRSWAQYGKVMMLLSGLACVGLATYQEPGALHWFLRLWVGGFGLANVVFAWRHRS